MVKRHRPDKNWKFRYGITARDVGELVAAQGGKCAICDTPFAHKGKHAACVDHDHVTKQVRGILCSECNIGVGKFKESPALLMAALDYIVYHDPAHLDSDTDTE